MAVTSVGLISKTFGITVNDRGVLETTYTKVFKVVLDDEDTHESDILNASGLPVPFEPYENDFSARLRSKKPSLFDQNSRLVYLVTCEWSTLTPPESQEQNPEDPLSAPVEFSTSTTTMQKVKTHDIDGNTIQNFIQEAPDPPLEEPVYIDVNTFVRNEATYSRAVARSYKGKVSSAAIAGDPAGEWLCFDISAEKIVTHDPPYYRVTYVFHVLEGGWQPEILEASYLVISEDALSFVRATDDNGQPTAGPIMIDANGEKTDTPVYTKWETKESANFLALGLPFE